MFKVDVRAIQRREPFQQMVLELLDVYIHKNSKPNQYKTFHPYFTLDTKLTQNESQT